MRSMVLSGVFILSFVCRANNGSAQEAKAVVAGPKTAAVGDLVILDASQSQGQAFRWLLLNSSKTFLPVENGRRLVFASGMPQEYVFVLVAAGCNSNGNVAVDVAEHRLVLQGLTPTPPTPATPALPHGRYGFAQAAYAWVFAVVPAEQRGAAEKLADNFEAAGAAIAAGSYDQFADSEAIRQVTASLQDANRKTLRYVDDANPGDTPAWREFFARWQAKADQHNPPTTSVPKGDGTLRVLKDYADAFQETTQGLRAAVAPAPTVIPRS